MSQKARRPRNSGSISKTKTGFKGRVDLGLGPDGKRKVKTVSGKTKKEVEAKMQAVRTEQEQGADPFGKNPRLGDYLDLWLLTKEKNIAPKTVRCYRQNIDNHLKPGLGSVKLKDLTTDQVDAFLTLKQKDGYSSDTIRLMRTTLNTALKYALKTRKITFNPVSVSDPPKREHKVTDVLDVRQVRILLAACKGKPYGLAIELATKTGLRKGEVLGLMWDDVDFDSGLLHVRRQFQRIDGEWKSVGLKTAKARRIIPIDPELVEQLRLHKGQQFLDQMRDDWKWHGLIFCTRNGTPYDERNILTYLKQILKEAGLPPIRFHDLRHTYATLLRSIQVETKDISERLGHSNTAITQDLYMHAVREAQRGVTDKFSQLLSEEDSPES